MAKIIPIPIGPIFNGGPCRGLVHVIEKGDTLYQLGKRYHVSVGQLLFANPFVNVYNLQIGDELCIPISPQPRNQEQNLDMPMQGGRMPGEEMEWNQRMPESMPGEEMEWNPQPMTERMPWEQNPDNMEGYMPGEQPEDMLETIPFHEESESGMTDGM